MALARSFTLPQRISQYSNHPTAARLATKEMDSKIMRYCQHTRNIP